MYKMILARDTLSIISTIEVNCSTKKMYEMSTQHEFNVWITLIRAHSRKLGRTDGHTDERINTHAKKVTDKQEVP